ncbi:FecR family protein [Blastomonas aquatica]|nr:FecR domain-containing protein [Blastomonas aquatica]
MSASVNDDAIRWAIRIDAGTMDDAQKLELSQWLAQDSRHRGALFRAQAGLALVEAAADEPAGPALDRGNRSSNRLMATAVLAACLATILVLVWPLLSAQQIRTDVGEIRRVTLSDGSVAMVNSKSSLEVDYEEAVRQLSLTEGEAWFKVSTDTKRPFVVAAGDVRVRATGTAFSVRRRGLAVEVVVTDGTVLVWRTGQRQDAVAVAAGNATMVDSPPRSKPVTVPIGDRDLLAWREGGLALNEMTVFEAAEEFNRYNIAKIEIANPRIGQHTMTGYFQLDRPDEFSQAVSDVTGARFSKKVNKYVIE